MTPPSAVFLDTNALLAFGRSATPLPGPVKNRVREAGEQQAIYISPVSAWEIAQGLRGKPKPDYTAPRAAPLAWWRTVLALEQVSLAPLTPEIAFDAYAMPEPFHKDPADRLLVATARALGCPIVTSDRAIAAYGRLGHVQVIGF